MNFYFYTVIRYPVLVYGIDKPEPKPGFDGVQAQNQGLEKWSGFKTQPAGICVLFSANIYTLAFVPGSGNTTKGIKNKLQCRQLISGTSRYILRALQLDQRRQTTSQTHSMLTVTSRFIYIFIESLVMVHCPV